MSKRSKYLTREFWHKLVEERERPRQFRLKHFGSPRKEADRSDEYKAPRYVIDVIFEELNLL